MMKEMAECRRLMAEALLDGDDKKLRRVTRKFLDLWHQAYPS